MTASFTNLRELHAQRAEELNRQRESVGRQAAETLNLLTGVVQAPGYKVLKDALIASAEAEHRKALTSKDAHAMALALGAEQAFRAAAHAAEDIIAACQNTIQGTKPR